MDSLDLDTLSHIFLLFGNTPYAFIQRLRCKQVCKLFNHMDVLLFSSNIGGLKITRYTMNIRRFLQADILMYDLDDMRWTKSADIRKGNNRAFQVSARVLWNPFTFKFCTWNRNVKHWIQSLTLEKVVSFCRHKHDLPKSPDDILNIEVLSTRSTRRIINVSDSETEAVHFFMMNMCKGLKHDINRHIVALSLKDTYCSTAEFELLARALPDSQIVKLNISGHLCDEAQLQIGSIFLNAQKLEHLNFNYCGSLSQYDKAAFIQMLMKPNSLCTLKFLYTEVTENEDIDLFLRLCGRSDNIQYLFLSFPYDYQPYMRMGNVRELYYTSPNCDHVKKLDLSCDVIRPYQPLRSDELAVFRRFVQTHISDASHVNKKRKLTLTERYARRNLYRNQLTKEARRCISCGFVWPAGSLKIQTFEGLQSRCKLTNRHCSETSHAAKLLDHDTSVQ